MQAHRRLSLFTLRASAAICALVFSAAASAQAQMPAATSADGFVNGAAQMLTLLSQGKTADVWQATSPEMQKREKQEVFSKSISSKYTGVGTITGRQWVAVNRLAANEPPATEKNPVPAGQYVNVVFVSSTNTNRTLTERVTFYLDKDNTWRPMGFVVQ